jgi:hypothetical protein
MRLPKPMTSIFHAHREKLPDAQDETALDIEALGNVADTRKRLVYVRLAEKPHFARGGLLESQEAPQQCRFTRSIRTDERDQLAFRDPEINAVEDGPSAERNPKVSRFNHYRSLMFRAQVHRVPF